MIALVRCLVVVALAACSSTSPVASSVPTPEVASAGASDAGADAAADAVVDAAAVASCVDDGKPFDEAALRARLEALASKELDGRAPGTDGDRAARKIIAERFRCLGLSAAGDDDGYAQAFGDTANVVGYIPGGREIIVVGAHHDHLGDDHLGANDNASGVVALLAIAQQLAQRDGELARTVAFVTFGAEEQGLVGSQHFVKHPPAELPLDRVVQYVNLDMVGSYRSKNVVYAFGTFAKQPATKALAKARKRYRRLNVGTGGHSVRGDQLGFCTAKIPYVFFWTPDRRCYHRRCDTADAIDYPQLAQIADVAGALVEELATTKTDLAASRRAIGCFGR